MAIQALPPPLHPYDALSAHAERGGKIISRARRRGRWWGRQCAFAGCERGTTADMGALFNPRFRFGNFGGGKIQTQARLDKSNGRKEHFSLAETGRLAKMDGKST